MTGIRLCVISVGMVQAPIGLRRIGHEGRSPAVAAEGPVKELEIKDALHKALHRPKDGIYALAAEHEKESRESMVASLAAMEKLAVECEALKDMTVAEVLERDPEIRAQIEEEIRNHVWAP